MAEKKPMLDIKSNIGFRGIDLLLFHKRKL